MSKQINNSTKIGFLGGGNLATALIAGLVRPREESTKTQRHSTGSNYSPNDIWVFDHNPDKNSLLHQQHGVRVAEHINDLVSQVDVLVLAVKPQSLKKLLSEYAALITDQHPLVISVAAGITTSALQQWLHPSLAIVRAMPNTPALIGEGATGLFANSQTNHSQRTLTESILSSVGKCVWVNSDADIDAVTALSGSGPAYFLLLTSALIKAGVNAGLPQSTARELALQTARGAALLVESSDKTVDELINNIKSPKGTTEQLIQVLTKADLDGLVDNAFNAARERAAEMSTEFG